MKTEYVRRLSSGELLFADLDHCGINMTFHYFLRLDRMPDQALVEKAYADTVALHPGMNLRLKGRRWALSHEKILCQTVETGEDFLERCPVRLNPKKTTLGLQRVHVQPQDQWYLCFHFFHGCADGRAALTFICDFFSLLRQEQPQPGECGYRYEDLLLPVERPAQPLELPMQFVCKANTCQKRQKLQHRTMLIQTPGEPKGVSARLCIASWKRFTGKRRMTVVPVDLRRHCPEHPKLMGNLIQPLLVYAADGMDLQRLRQKMLVEATDRRKMSGSVWSLRCYSAIPKPLRRMIVRLACRCYRGTNHFLCCAMCSHVGKIQKEQLAAKDLQVTDLFVTFTDTPLNALTVVTVQFDGHTNVTLSWDGGRLDEALMEQIVSDIREALE